MYVGDNREEEKEKNRFDSASFGIVITHEFGHVLGIKDGYNDSETKYIDSIICD